MSASSSRQIVLVVGVGRSGTSLAMQALRRLGATISERLVPASEANRHGPLEDLEVRDRMAALWKEFDGFRGPRPAGWQQTVIAQEVEDWLKHYLARRAAASDAAPFAVKFPLASLFLPLWLRAARQSGVRLRLIWATRGTAAVIGSFARTYGTKAEIATGYYAQRTFYLLRDAPEDTLLLPYEGWQTDPAGQLAELARAACLPLPGVGDLFQDLYDANEDHGAERDAPAADLLPVLRRADDALAERRGALSEILGGEARDALAGALEDILKRARPAARRRGSSDPANDDVKGSDMAAKDAAETESEESKALIALRGERDHLRGDLARLRDEREAARGEAARLRAERHALRETIEAKDAEIATARDEATRLRGACEALTRERDRGDETMADMASRHATALGAANARVVQAQAAAKATRAKLEVAAAERRRDAEAAKETVKALRKRLNGQKRAAREKAGALRDQLERKSAQAAKAQARAENKVKRIALLKKRIAEAPEGTRAVIAVPGAAQASETRSPVAVRRGRALVPELVRRAGRRVVALPARLVRDRKRPD